MIRFVIVILLPLIVAFGAEAMVMAGTQGDVRVTAVKKKPTSPTKVATGTERKGTSEVTVEVLTLVIQKYLEKEWKQKVATVSVTVLEPAESVVISGDSADLHVIPGPTEEGPGRRMFRVAVTNGKSQKTIQVVADVTAMIDAIIPSRFLKANEPIDVEDIKTVRMRVHQVNHPFMTNESEVIGMSAARPLPPDVPLRAAFIRPPLAVQKGDRVLIEVQRGGLSIRTYGITKSSGRVGQTITVANLDSGRELTAKVVGPSLVQVEF
ncbi:MAG: flagella basal body P-ring formation protein FlgA [Nitrospira sp. WS110]|nr:flagella basal body P-ring formation protein FlgA [Nitrospira sp. WS110]